MYLNCFFYKATQVSVRATAIAAATHADATFCHCWFLRLVQTYVTVVFFVFNKKQVQAEQVLVCTN